MFPMQKDFIGFTGVSSVLNVQNQNSINANKFVAHVGEWIGSGEFNTIGILW